eukprot:4858209-Amphidinium_carterae.1
MGSCMHVRTPHFVPQLQPRSVTDEHVYAIGEIASYDGGMIYQIAGPGDGEIRKQQTLRLLIRVHGYAFATQQFCSISDLGMRLQNVNRYGESTA